MNEPAKNTSDNTVDTTGLEHVFVQEKSSESSTDSQMTDDKPESVEGTWLEEPYISSEDEKENEQIDIQDVQATIQVSMAEASRRLDMPYPTLRRHVLAGKIPSKLDEDGKRIVLLQPDEYSDEQDDDKSEQSESSANKQEFSEAIQLLIDELRDSQTYSRNISEKMIELQGQNGYLQGRLESKEEEVKLLTDRSKETESERIAKQVEQENEQLKSQLEQLENQLKLSNRSAWTKFCSWFIGKKE